jgi:RNA polymerase sigma factor (sigma-70 family)
MTTLQFASAPGSLRHPVTSPGDGQLLHDFATSQDQAAFTQIVRRHGPLVLGVCHRVLQHTQDAEDAFQATFLVLARNAHSVRKGEALASWLYGTAYRIAMKAKRDAARRRQHERQAKRTSRASAPTELAWHEVQSALDEELERLSPAYRSAFVLCCLQGLSLANAAQQLGVKEGTVSSRLTRARKRLQEALGRRGIALSALLAALAVSGEVMACVPRPLVKHTARAALEFRAGTVKGLSAQVVSLAEGAVNTMFATRTKLLAIALLLTFGLLSFGAVHLRPQGTASERMPPAEKPPPQAIPEKAAEEKQEAEKHDRLRIAGRVLDQEDKPVTGARVYLLDMSPPEQPPKVQATSGRDGRFAFSLAKADVKRNLGYRNPWMAVFLVASAEGYGPAMHRLSQPDAKEERVLRLVRDDAPITGRVLDLEGQPLAGVQVEVDVLAIPKEKDLSSFWKAVQARQSAYPPENTFLDAMYSPRFRHLFPKVTTDRKGRFTIKGVGRERVVGLIISGPGIETRKVRVLTRQIKSLTVPAWKNNPEGHTFVYHGARFDHVAAPSSPIVGVVRDKDTGKPIPRAIVYSYKFAGNNIHGLMDLHTVADEQGRYRLTGMPRGEGNKLLAHPPKDLTTITQPYVMAIKNVPKSDGLRPVTVDFELKRGVWIEGKAIDKITGKPVFGRIEYFAFADNAHLADYPGFMPPQWLDNQSQDGTFKLVGLPGHGLLAFRAHGDGYLIGAGADKVKAKRDRYFYPTRPYYCHAEGYHAFLDLNPEPGTKSITCKVLLDPGLRMTGTILDPKGKPLPGVLIRGLRSYSSNSYWEREPRPTPQFTVMGMTSDRPRHLLFLHKEKKLAGSLLLKGNEKAPLTVTLQPAGTITGRLVDEDGQPQGGARLGFTGPRRRVGDKEVLEIGSHPTQEFTTNPDGTFRIEGLAPGLKYHLARYEANKRTMLAEDLMLEPGETKDLGDVRGLSPR